MFCCIQSAVLLHCEMFTAYSSYVSSNKRKKHVCDFLKFPIDINSKWEKMCWGFTNDTHVVSPTLSIDANESHQSYVLNKLYTKITVFCLFTASDLIYGAFTVTWKNVKTSKALLGNHWIESLFVSAFTYLQLNNQDKTWDNEKVNRCLLCDSLLPFTFSKLQEFLPTIEGQVLLLLLLLLCVYVCVCDGRGCKC